MPRMAFRVKRSKSPHFEGKREHRSRVSSDKIYVEIRLTRHNRDRIETYLCRSLNEPDKQYSHTMKRIIFILCTLFLVPLYLLAGGTTYTFTSYKWASSVGATVCDGTTDGWVSDKDAYNQTYSNGYNDAQGLPYGWGVSVKKSTTGAGATSVIAFEDVRRIVINFCQNKSGGKGVINIKVGDNESVGLTVNKPTDGKGDYNRDSVIVLPAKQSGRYLCSTVTTSASGGASLPAECRTVLRLAECPPPC